MGLLPALEPEALAVTVWLTGVEVGESVSAAVGPRLAEVALNTATIAPPYPELPLPRVIDCPCLLYTSRCV